MSIEEDDGLKVVAEASDGEMALAMIRKHHPHIAVLDIDMPKLDGLGVAREIARQKLEVKIIFLTFHADEDLFRTAMDLGSLGYILKDSASQEIVAGVRAVASGRSYISAAITENLLHPTQAPPPQDTFAAKLTPTERRIMRLI